jgi:hypothetical protein
MCGCAENHPGIWCRGIGCHCHDEEEGVMEEEVYMTVSFYRVSKSKADEILMAAIAVAGTSINMSVSYLPPLLDDEED